MNDAHRLVILVIGILITPLLPRYEFEDKGPFIGFGGPLLSIAIGTSFCVGRKKEQPPGGW